MLRKFEREELNSVLISHGKGNACRGISFGRVASVMGMAQNMDLTKGFRNGLFIREWDDENHKQPQLPNLP